jgi:hypothetical protein
MGSALAVLFAILFLIPGFIWQKTVQIFSAYSRPKKIDLLEYLTLSCINYLFAIPVVCFLLTKWPADLDAGDPGSILEKLGYCYLAGWLSLVFILPVICGILTAKLPRWKRVKGLLKKVGISFLHPAPTAWDYAFARDQEYWARIELKNDEYVEGIFGEHSLASSEPGECDIFLEAVYELVDEETERYESAENNEGIYVSGDEIRTITFFALAREESTDGGSEIVRPGDEVAQGS